MKIYHLILGLLCLIALYFLGYAVSVLPFKIILILVIGFIFALLTLMNLEVGLFLFIFIVPFTQQLTLAQFGHTPVEIGTDDIFMIFIILSWLVSLARRKEPIFLKTSLNWPIVAFFSMGVFSFIGAHKVFGPGAVLLGFLHLFKFFEYVVIYFIVVSTINNLDQIKKYLSMFFTVAGFIAILQVTAMFRWGIFSFRVPPTGFYHGLYLASMHTFASEAILGAYYCFFLSFLLIKILDTPVSKGKVPLVLLGTLLSFALFNTYSRSAYLGLVVVFFILSIFKEKKLFLIILLLLVFSPIYMQSAVLTRITLTIRAFSPTVIFDPSVLVRFGLWKRALQVILDNIIFGTGYWTTRWALPGSAHNQYLAIFVEMGVVGFSIFCWLIIRMFKNAIILMKRADTEFLKALGLGYIAGLAALLTICFFSEPLEAFRIVGPLWFMTGLITSANRLLSEKSEKLDIDST